MNQSMKGPMDVAVPGEQIVSALVLRTFILTLADGTPIRVMAGTQQMPQSIAEHFYSKAHGVKIVPAKAPKAEKPTVARTLDDDPAAKETDAARLVLSVKK